MSFYLYDKPLQFHLHYTTCWVLKTCNLYSSGCFFVVEVAWTQLTGDYLAFSGTIKPARWYRHLRQAFFSSTVVAVEFSGNQQGKSPFFLWNVIGFRLPAFGNHVFYLVLMQSDPSPFPLAEAEYHIVVYHINPSSATANTTATLYTVATMAINIKL